MPRERCTVCNGGGYDQDDMRSLRGKQKKINELDFDFSDVCGPCEHCDGSGDEPTHEGDDNDEQTEN